MTAAQFDETYYERGVSARVSGYKNYHWRPEYSLPFANELKRRYLNPEFAETVYDFGCAKGYLVKAFRLLNVEAYGYDISDYAIAHADPAVARYVSNCLSLKCYDLVVSKDVLEHVPHAELPAALLYLYNRTADNGTCVITVPLGDNGEYRIREYELDVTHQIRENEEWWIDACRAAGLYLAEFYYNFPGAKDHWVERFPHGNATFVLRRS